MQIYNSLTRRKESFRPGDPERVTMYVCGPTVYSHPHIGNARPAVVFDVLYRVLDHLYPKVVYARNITDLDDKINAAAAEEGVSIDVVSERYTKVYHQDMRSLGVLPRVVEPRATDHIAQMIAMIETLIEKGHAYHADGHVLFNVETFASYGALSGRDRREMIAGARVEVAPYKKDPADFVLWKPSSGIQPGWDSPWGFGRPGWHLECSAMIEAHLGETIDIHGGGHDLQFPHHENEIAQSTCAHDGELYCRYWMHNGFVNLEDRKISKSEGNVLLVRELLDQGPGESIRLALLSAHYRQPLNWKSDTLSNASRELDRLYQALRDDDDASSVEPDPADPVLAALQDDLNTPKAMAAMHELARRASSTADADRARQLRASLKRSGQLLGLLSATPSEWEAAWRRAVDGADEIEALIAARETARKARDFDEADRIRDLLAARNIVLKDGPEGTTWWPGQ